MLSCLTLSLLVLLVSFWLLLLQINDIIVLGQISALTSTLTYALSHSHSHNDCAGSNFNVMSKLYSVSHLLAWHFVSHFAFACARARFLSFVSTLALNLLSATFLIVLWSLWKSTQYLYINTLALRCINGV